MTLLEMYEQIGTYIKKHPEQIDQDLVIEDSFGCITNYEHFDVESLELTPLEDSGLILLEIDKGGSPI